MRSHNTLTGKGCTQESHQPVRRSGWTEVLQLGEVGLGSTRFRERCKLTGSLMVFELSPRAVTAFHAECLCTVLDQSGNRQCQAGA